MTRALVEAAIEADPDDERAWAVYADLLIADGDWRGEMIFANLATVAKQRRVLLGELARLDAGGDTFVFHRGFLREVNLQWAPGDLTDAVGEILRHPAARFLRYLTVTVGVVEDGWTCQSLLDEVAGTRPRCLEELKIDAFSRDTGDLDGVLALPRLTELVVLGHDSRLSRSSPRLQRLELAPAVSAATVRKIGSLDWPRLETLSLWSNLPDGSSVDDLRGIFDGAGLPSLRVLGLAQTPSTDDLVQPLLRSRILSRLAELDLSHGGLSDRGARHLLAEYDSWRHLEKLNLHRNVLAETVDALRSKSNVEGLDSQYDSDDE